MSHHFRSFTFVDRIHAVQPGVSVRGQYSIPASLTEFSGSLVAEATGQLAAWSAMAAVDFKARPVAGIAGLVEMLAPVAPGQTLELAAEIESVDADAIAYGGTASVSGSPVLKLHHCVGPMLPIEDFDDPVALREHFELLKGSGAAPGGFGGVPQLPLENLSVEAAKLARATIQAPTQAAFFEDHFPRKPVFPGSLLMQFNLQLVGKLAATLGGAPTWRLATVSDMKLRTFIPPGEVLNLECKVVSHDAKSAEISVESKRGARLVGAATVGLVAN